ncbi:hypothetical protein PR202_gb05253 [Eleusine coracana subsp. coracana]|uniref:RING-type E3 ubiquitin transferase n=1 Tax=Eleusine coracana subsp. coracana TaxID=191504 RepID=A0AAV5E6G9_ELECO|nr:hypothetical protein PR202_gb05253 [Eleusine coracana subsp. coracana]
MVCTPQVIDLESERGQARGGNGDISDQGAQHAVRVVENVTSFGLSDMRSYYDVSVNHQHLPVHNPPSNLVADSGFAFASSSSSSSHAPQNHALRPWDPSFESNVPPNIVPLNPSEHHSHSGWSSMEGSSITGANGFNSVVRPESTQRGNYTFPTTHISHAWMSQAANGIADGVPYVNATSNVQGRFTHSGATEVVNGGFHEYQSTPSTVCRGPHGAVMDFSRLYEVSNVVDEHRDMRLDIDSMTYEELLALEERIGDVNTGLTKSHIEEYQDKDCVGILDCGHRYHAECVKQWLTVKNICPICKTTALSADRRNGQ